MSYHEFAFKSCTGDELFAWSMEPEGKSTVRLILVHGLGEHSGRYREFAAFLVSKGYSVYAYDYRGFGKSPGRRGHCNSFDSYFQDLHRFVQIIRDPWNRSKTILLGHSLGGLIGLAFGIRYPEAVDGLVITSPALKSYPVPKVLQQIAKICSVCAPWLPMKNRLDVDKLSHDPEVVAAYKNDPLVHDKVTPRFFHELMRVMQHAQQNASAIRRPLLLMYAGEDRMVDPGGVREFALGLEPDLPVEVVRYEHMYHEILNEVGKEAIWEKVCEWVRGL